MGIGTELLMGELTDTNSSWIASRLPALGIELQWVSIIGDDLPRLTEAFKQGMKRSDIIFTTGGLGLLVLVLGHVAFGAPLWPGPSRPRFWSYCLWGTVIVHFVFFALRAKFDFEI